MKIKILSLNLVFISLFACGTKTSKLPDAIVIENKALVEKINSNNALKETVIEGSLTDATGSVDTGTFKNYFYFNDETKILDRIKNIEITTKKVTENFYFNNNKLIYIGVEKDGESKKELILNNEIIINKPSIDSDYQKILINKGNMFQKEFKKRP